MKNSTFFIFFLCLKFALLSCGPQKKNISPYNKNTPGYQSLRILVIAPHPDDDILGCGGSIAQHIRKGDCVTIVYMTSGEAMENAPRSAAHNLKTLREQEARAAANVLGVTNLIFLCYPDGQLPQPKNPELNAKIVIQLIEKLREHKPDILYIPHKYDKHADHRITNELVLQAIAQTKQAPHEAWLAALTILCYEIWTPLQNANRHVDISHLIDLKLTALRKHASQLNKRAYDDAILGLNRYRGVMMGKGARYAESFECIKCAKPLNSPVL
jgi:LmbE family N-acetylglucosaminyl deacetylase